MLSVYFDDQRTDLGSDPFIINVYRVKVDGPERYDITLHDGGTGYIQVTLSPDKVELLINKLQAAQRED